MVEKNEDHSAPTENPYAHNAMKVTIEEESMTSLHPGLNTGSCQVRPLHLLAPVTEAVDVHQLWDKENHILDGNNS